MNVVVTNISAASLELPFPFWGTVAAAGSKTLQVSLSSFVADEKLIPLQNDVKSGKLRVEFSDQNSNNDPNGLLDEAVKALIAGFAEIRVVSQITDAAASTATANRILGIAGAGRLYVKAIKIVNVTLIAADNTDYLTALFTKKSAVFGSAVTLATVVTTVAGGALIAGTTAATISGNDAARTLAENEVVALDIAKAGSGKQLIGAVEVTYMMLPSTLRVGNL